MLKRIHCLNFRCFSRLEFEPGAGTNFLVGNNAQGKTSILEAICVLLRLQSPRTTSLSQAVRVNDPGFVLDGLYGDHHLRLKLDAQGRHLELDSVVQARSDSYLSVARISWFSNDDMELVRGAAGQRRRYLDFIGAQTVPGYLKELRAYERALRSRNLLLKDGRAEREVQAYTVPLIQAGEFLRDARRRLIEGLAPLLAEACAEISQQRESASGRYKSGIEGDFAEALAKSQAQEQRLRQTVVGPHRDDVILQLNGMDAASFASEGQQRTLAVSLKLAQTRYLEAQTGTAPILLIDDVFGELDPQRRNTLLAALPVDSQKIITTTFLDWHEVPAATAVFGLAEHSLTRRG